MINGVVVFCIILFILAILFIKNIYELVFALALLVIVGCITMNLSPTELATLIKDSWTPLLEYIKQYIDNKVG